MNANRVIGVDLGGTKILAGIIERDGTIVRRRERPTPTESQEALIAGLQDAVRELWEDGVAAVGFGMPTRIDQATGRIEGGAVNIPLHKIDFRSIMEAKFGVPVGAENDGSSAALAEFVAGAGRGTRSLVALTLGTGVGGGVVYDGKLFRGWAEFGHMVIEYDGLPCQGSCTGRGHLEAYASGHAASRLAGEAFGEGTDAHRLVRLAEEGDPTARKILDGIGRRLGAAIGSLVNIYNPEVVVVGGGFGAAGDWLIEPAREVANREALDPAAGDVRIVRAELGTAAGLIGAGLIAFEALGS